MEIFVVNILFSLGMHVKLGSEHSLSVLLAFILCVKLGIELVFMYFFRYLTCKVRY